MSLVLEGKINAQQEIPSRPDLRAECCPVAPRKVLEVGPVLPVPRLV